MKESLNLNNQIVIYQSKDGKIQLDVKLENETVWLNRQQLSELFGRDIKTIGKWKSHTNLTHPGKVF